MANRVTQEELDILIQVDATAGKARVTQETLDVLIQVDPPLTYAQVTQIEFDMLIKVVESTKVFTRTYILD